MQWWSSHGINCFYCRDRWNWSSRRDHVWRFNLRYCGSLIYIVTDIPPATLIMLLVLGRWMYSILNSPRISIHLETFL